MAGNFPLALVAMLKTDGTARALAVEQVRHAIDVTYGYLPETARKLGVSRRSLTTILHLADLREYAAARRDENLLPDPTRAVDGPRSSIAKLEAAKKTKKRE